MRKIILLATFIFVALGIFAQKTANKTVKSKIDSAVIYLTGAEIIRSKKVNLKRGRTQLTFKNISSKINTRSIRVTTDNGVDILSVSSKLNYLVMPEKQPQIDILKDSLELISFKIEDITDEKGAYIAEKKLLKVNNQIGGTQNGVPIAELKMASNFYRTRTLEINKSVRELERKALKLIRAKTRINHELAELNANSSYTRSEIIVLVSSHSNAYKNIQIKYLVADAGWAPAYDIKAEDTDKPVQLIYRAKVFNNTGIAWENLKMKLSTADPTLSVTQPNLKPWLLSYKTYGQQAYYQNNRQQKSNQQLQISPGEGYFQNDIAGEAVTDGLFGNVTNSSNYSSAALPELNAEFKISRTYSVPSDDKPYLIDVSEHELPASYKHYAVTKLDKGVFLLARITGWEDLNLVEGPANVYYAGTYLGQSFIKTRDVSDTLNLSLGRDGKVIVTRSKLKKFSSSQFIGNKRKETLTYEIIVKNNRKSSIEIDIHDQLPISQSDEIVVKALEISDAIANPATGELKWKYRLNPGQVKKIRLSFSIKYPKGKTIEISKKKVRSVRKF